LRCVLYLLVLCIGIAVFSLPARKSEPKDIWVQLQPEEGYLQAWNFRFSSDNLELFSTFLISNFGPGQLNNGISLFLKPKKGEKFYSTQEFAEDDLSLSKEGFQVRAKENFWQEKSGIYYVHLVFPEWTVDLELVSEGNLGVSLTGGKHPLAVSNKFVQADIPFSATKAKLTLTNEKGDAQIFFGKGGIEHILTNQEVYSYSKRWELFRAIDKNGIRIFGGGFLGKKSSDPDYRKVVVVSKSGKVLLDAVVEKNDILAIEVEPVSNYTLPRKEKLWLSSKCSIIVERNIPIAGISALENISTILRYLIGIFFAKPFQIHNEVEIQSECESWSGIAKGLHSYYLINE